MSAPNAELAYKILDQIDAHPETWQQGVWDCGTAACFAGWAVRLAGGKVDLRDGVLDPLVIDGPEELVGLEIPDAAEVALSASCVSPNLFDGSNTREDLGWLVAEIFGPRPGGAA